MEERHALLDAAADGDFATVERTFTGGVNVNDVSDEGDEKVLIQASALGHLDIVQALLAAGADPNQPRQKSRWTPLMYAANGGHVSVVEALLDGGASKYWVVAYDSVLARTTGDRKRVIYADEPALAYWISGTDESALVVAIRNRHVDVVDVLLSADTPVNRRQDLFKWTLELASRMRWRDMVIKLLDAGADPNQTSDRHMTALMAAAEYGFGEIVDVLLARGADVNMEKHLTNFTALTLAIQNGWLEIVEKLVAAGANVNHTFVGKNTPLLCAVSNGRVDIAECLVRAGAYVCMETANQHPTALAFAAERGQADMVELFLQVDDVAVDHVGRDSNTTLLNAVAARSVDTVQAINNLLAGGANVDYVNDVGDTALIRAACAGNLAIVDLLLGCGVRVDHTNPTGSTALLYASRWGYVDIVESLLRTGQASINLANSIGETPLSVAVKHGHATAVEVLLAWGADIECAIRHRITNDGPIAANLAVLLAAAG